MRKNDSTPATTVVLMMSLSHFCHLLTIWALVTRLYPNANFDFTKLQVFFFAIGFQALCHILIYNKQRWMRYIDEFKDEIPSQRKKGTIILYSYFFASYVLFVGLTILLFL